MKPYNRIKKTKHFIGKKDINPPKGFINWWERKNTVPRSFIKMQIKKDLTTI